MMVTKKLSKFKKVVITATAAVLALSSTASMSAGALSQTISVSAKSSRVILTISIDSNSTIIVNELTCIEKHPTTGDVDKVTGSNASGATTSLTTAIKPDNGYKFVTDNRNKYVYKIGSGSFSTVQLPPISG